MLYNTDMIGILTDHVVKYYKPLALVLALLTQFRKYYFILKRLNYN